MEEARNQGEAEDEDEQGVFWHAVPFLSFGIPADFAGFIIAQPFLGRGGPA
ncbi:hypothetical protein D3C80_2241440 [compost metagenome]